MNLFCSLPPVRISDWIIKASSFDDQILVWFKHELWLDSELRMFYNEEQAYKFLERLNHDYSIEINNR